MKTLLISGKSGSGKDALAYCMMQELLAAKKRSIITHYGDPVKFFAEKYFDWDGIKDETGRHLLQTLGTDIVRSVFPDYWTGIIVGFLKAMEVYEKYDVAIIADVRFPNEEEIPFDMLNDVVSIRIERHNPDGTPWENPVLTEEQRQHPSETSMDNHTFDYVVHNDAGLEELHDSAYAILVDLNLIEDINE